MCRQRAAAEASRKDAKLQYVIISEKWDKKSSKYKAPSVPFPFDSRETYERALRQPLGREYNTGGSGGRRPCCWHGVSWGWGCAALCFGGGGE